MSDDALQRCRDCGHEYGTFRARCPACGTPGPTPTRCLHGIDARFCAVCTGTTRAVTQARATRAERRDKPDACILCRRRVKPNKRGTTCPHCNEKIHVACLELHRAACLKFQFEREAAYDRLAKEHKP